MTLFQAYCIYFENIQSTSNLHPIYIQSTSNLHPICIQSTSNLSFWCCCFCALLNLHWFFTESLLFFFLAKSPGHVELACPFLLWSSFLFLCSSSWSFALWVWSPASFVPFHCPLAVAVCIPGDFPSPGRRTSIRRSSTCRTTSWIEAYHGHRYIPNLCRWTIWNPNRNLRVLDILGFNKAVGEDVVSFFVLWHRWVDWTGYRSTTDVDAWQTSKMFKFQIKVSVRKEYLDYGLNIQVPKGGEDQFLKLLGIRWNAGTMVLMKITWDVGCPKLPLCVWHIVFSVLVLIGFLQQSFFFVIPCIFKTYCFLTFHAAAKGILHSKTHGEFRGRSFALAAYQHALCKLWTNWKPSGLCDEPTVSSLSSHLPGHQGDCPKFRPNRRYLPQNWVARSFCCNWPSLVCSCFAYSSYFIHIWFILLSLLFSLLDTFGVLGSG